MLSRSFRCRALLSPAAHDPDAFELVELVAPPPSSQATDQVSPRERCSGFATVAESKSQTTWCVWSALEDF
eukprot:232741-Pleurochrysis_carterae.AAC.3